MSGLTRALACPSPLLRPVFDFGHSTTDLALALCLEAQSVCFRDMGAFCMRRTMDWTDPASCLPSPPPLASCCCCWALCGVAATCCCFCCRCLARPHAPFIVLLPAQHPFIHIDTGTQTRQRGAGAGEAGNGQDGWRRRGRRIQSQSRFALRGTSTQIPRAGASRQQQQHQQ